MPIPDALPTLSAGSHDAEHGEACVMEYVSLLAGEEWSDRPECTHPLLAHEARTANDLLRESDRARLVPLIGRLFGTTDDFPELRARLRIAQARQVMTLLEPAARPRALGAVERAESWIGRSSDEDDVRQALEEAMSFPLVPGDLDAEHVAFHQGASRMFPFALSPELGAAEAYALTALVITHRIAASGECRADCGNGPARARRMVKDLAGLIEVYDEVTGRIARDVSAGEVRELADTIRWVVEVRRPPAAGASKPPDGVSRRPRTSGSSTTNISRAQRLACDHSSRRSTGHVVTMRSAGTPLASARSAP